MLQLQHCLPYLFQTYPCTRKFLNLLSQFSESFLNDFTINYNTGFVFIYLSSDTGHILRTFDTGRFSNLMP